MTFADNLKAQLNSFVDAYKNYFNRTFGTALTFTIVCVAMSVVLIRYSEFPSRVLSNVSILNYFFETLSSQDVYCLADLSRIIFIFCVSIFSISLTRLIHKEEEKKELGFSSFLKAITWKDLSALIITLIAAVIADVGLTKLYGLSTSNITVDRYITNIWYHLRIYIPMILFTLTVHSLIMPGRGKISMKKILFLYVIFWILNSLSYQLSLWVSFYIFRLFLLPVEDPEKYYLIESFLSIPLIACYFIGFYSAMTTTLKQTEVQPVIIANEEPV